MKFYELDTYLFIIYLKDFTSQIRCVGRSKLVSFIQELNDSDDVYDYVITRKMDYEY